MKHVTLGVAILLAGATALTAQTSTKTKSTLGPFGGALIPTGDQQDLMETLPVAGLQGSWELLPATTPTSLRIVGNVGWGFGDNKFGVTDNSTNILMYDAGLELGYTFPMGSSSEFRPFIGGGWRANLRLQRPHAEREHESRWLRCPRSGLHVQENRGAIGSTLPGVRLPAALPGSALLHPR